MNMITFKKILSENEVPEDSLNFTLKSNSNSSDALGVNSFFVTNLSKGDIQVQIKDVNGVFFITLK